MSINYYKSRRMNTRTLFFLKTIKWKRGTNNILVPMQPKVYIITW